MALDVFEIIDFRMISGLIGELFAVEVAKAVPWLKKNPNIDGYPDLLNLSTPDARKEFENGLNGRIDLFIDFKYGGYEVKNTFGTKKAGSDLQYGSSRIGKINKKLDWKAHHQKTNNLIGLHSDFDNGKPQIFALSFSSRLGMCDWKEKQQPKEGSTMTSFSVIESSGWSKMRDGIRICSSYKPFLDFYGVEL